MAIKFDVTYWQPQLFSAVAEDGEVLLALTGYIAEGNPSRTGAERAAKALLALSQGQEPEDMGIIARALRHSSFAAPEGTEPDQVDECTDYTVEIRRS